MKNDKHPIDDLFQRGLEQHSIPPPMHVWERIEESRNTRHKSKLILFRQKVSILSSAAAILLIGIWLAWPGAPELGSFPLLGIGSGDASIEELPKVKTQPSPSIQQAGLVPNLGNIIRNFTTEESKAETEEVRISPVEATEKTEPRFAESVSDKEPASSLPETSTLPAVEGSEPDAKVESVNRVVASKTLSPATTQPILMDYRALDVSPIAMPETGCARFSEGRPALFLAVTADPMLPTRNFTARSEEDLAFANQRSSTESVRLSYGGSARLSVVFPWGGAIRSGVNYTQINEQLVYKNSKVRIITDIYDPNGQVIGTDTTYHEGDSALKFNNRHRLIDIPVQLGYEIRYDKVTLAANAGINVNVAYSQEGSYLSADDLVPTRFDSNDPGAEPVYKSRLGIGWQASLGLHYQLNDRLDLMAEPYMRYYPKSFTRDDYPLKQKYMVGGIGLGLRVLL